MSKSLAAATQEFGFLKLTRQEAFNRVWEHFSAPGASLSMDECRNVCRYRGEGGARCAIGVLLADDEYDATLEGKSAGQLLGEPYPLRSEPAHFYAALQYAHDEADSVVGCLEELRRVAGEYGLKVPGDE